MRRTDVYTQRARCFRVCQPSESRRCRCSCGGKDHGLQTKFWAFCETGWCFQAVGRKDAVLEKAEEHKRKKPEHAVKFGHGFTSGYVSAESMRRNADRREREIAS